jgi:hypothetical protein
MRHQLVANDNKQPGTNKTKKTTSVTNQEEPSLLKGSGWAANSETPLAKKIRGSVNYFVYFNTY